ncbi:MAG: helix-turn-helix transcriptional regulator [Bacteroidota bacterium]
MKDFDTEINQRIKDFRESIKMSQKDFSARLEFNQSYLSEIERGKKEATIKIIKSLNAQFKVSSEWIMNGIGDIYLANSDIKQPENELTPSDTNGQNNLLRKDASEKELRREALLRMIFKKYREMCPGSPLQSSTFQELSDTFRELSEIMIKADGFMKNDLLFMYSYQGIVKKKLTTSQAVRFAINCLDKWEDMAKLFSSIHNLTKTFVDKHVIGDQLMEELIAGTSIELYLDKGADNEDET